jgi:CheY-like chemotaxis protein
MKLVLVIEDNLEIRENTAELLEISGYAVQTAENGLAGFKKALQLKPDVVICDMMMPGADGNTFFNLMNENKPTSKIPIIFFSAGTPLLKIRKHLIEHGDAYLEKPFTQQELLSIVTRFAPLK